MALVLTVRVRHGRGGCILTENHRPKYSRSSFLVKRGRDSDGANSIVFEGKPLEVRLW